MLDVVAVKSAVRISLWIASLAALCGCGHGKPGVEKRTFPQDAWKLDVSDPTDSTPALLWNGLIGIRIGRDGTGFAADGTSLPAFSCDDVETDGEERIRTLPNPLGVRWKVDGHRLTPVGADDYEQSLNLKNGILTTAWSQGGVSARTETIVDPLDRTVCQRWWITPTEEAMASVDSGFADATPLDSRGDGVGVYLVGQSKTKAVMSHAACGGLDVAWGRTDSSVQMACRIPTGKSLVFDRTVVYSPSPNRPYIEAAARMPTTPPGGPSLEKRDAPGRSFDAEEERCKQIWAERWQTDIEIDGPVADQQAIRSFLFYIRSLASSQSLMSVAPFGLSSSRYNGHVFWDADTWILPVQSLIDPDGARSIVEYRFARLGAAEDNCTLKLGPNPQKAAMFPWESGASGKEVAPPEFAKELHISGDVAFGAELAADLGAYDKKAADRIVVEVARMFVKRSAPGNDGAEIRDVMSPDENHTGDNDLYTNLLAQWCVDRARAIDPNIPALRFYLPSDKTSLLNYDRDALRGYKQPAAILGVFPLQAPAAEAQAQQLMDRFADKTTRNGPAMSDSVSAIVWARLGKPEDAYRDWLKSWQDFVRGPLLLFAERRSGADTYFATGAATCLQSVVYGFLGFRLDSSKGRIDAWSIELPDNRRLAIKPNLPTAWKRATFKNFHVGGHRYTLVATHSGCTLTKSD